MRSPTRRAGPSPIAPTTRGRRRCYRTGDEGYLDGAGLLHYIGRYDLQLKVNGYRIELGDIEQNLNALPEVALSCVVPVERDGACTALAAFVVPAVASRRTVPSPGSLNPSSRRCSPPTWCPAPSPTATGFPPT